MSCERYKHFLSQALDEKMQDENNRDVYVLKKPYTIVQAAEAFGVKNGHIKGFENVYLDSLRDYDTVADDYWPEYEMIFDDQDESYDNPVKMQNFIASAEPYAIIAEGSAPTRHLVIRIAYDLILDMKEFKKFAYPLWTDRANKSGWFCTDTDCDQWEKKNEDGTYTFVQTVWLDAVTDEEKKSQYVVIADDSVDVSSMSRKEKLNAISAYGYTDPDKLDDETIAECWFEEYCMSDEFIKAEFSNEDDAKIYILSEYIPDHSNSGLWQEIKDELMNN